MYRDLLVGSTGFVGGNLRAKHTFAAVCHSSDIAAQYGTQPDLCVYAGVPAAMFLANADPEADMEVMRTARENLRKIAPKSLVLISSIAVFADSRGRCEDDAPDTDGLPAYGRNRLQLEQWVREDFNDALIVRLPALYGDKTALKEFFAGNDFNALAFTDSRSRYQFYNLGRLWQDIETARAAGLTMLHLCTPPISAAEVYTAVTGKADWTNELPKSPFDYDLRSRYAAVLGGSGDYLCTKEEELDDVTNFLREWRD